MNRSAEKIINDLLTQIRQLDGMQEDDDDHDHDHEHHHHHHDAESLHHDEQPVGDLLVAKVTAMCTLFVASTLCGCIPFVLNRWFSWTQTTNGNMRTGPIINALLYFGGGVLLCTTFLHLLPEVAESIEHLQECNLIAPLNFHLPHLLMCIGFFAMFLVEEIIHIYLHRYRKNSDLAQEAFQRGRSIRNSSLVKGSAAADKTISCKEGEKTSDVESQIKEKQQQQEQHNGHSHSHVNHINENMIVSSLRGLLVVLALSVHELFEGLAVGLEARPSQVWYMFGAVSAHKLILAFCVGVELIVTRAKLWLALVYVLTFAVVSPLGIGVGIYLSADSGFASTIPSVILQGLASGTLLYVVFFEILSKERSGLVSYTAFVVGFLFMFGLQLATSGSHDHAHGSCIGAHHHEHHHDHNSHQLIDSDEREHFDSNTMMSSAEEKMKLIREVTEELAEALAGKVQRK